MSRADAAVEAKLSMMFQGRAVPQHWFTRREVLALLREPMAEVERLRTLAAACYAGLGSEHDLPEVWLDALSEAAEGRPFDTEGLLPYVAPVEPDTTRLNALRENSWDLRCIDVPTGAGDGDVHWIVIAHHMAAPHEREVARCFTDEPRDAIDAALAPQGTCGNGECQWRGALSECSFVGTTGPCCPECREIVEPDAAPQAAAAAPALMPARDAEFLTWLAARLVHVYGEPEGVDFVLATQRIARSIAADDTLEYKLSCLLDYATGGKLSKSSWALETMKAAIDENVKTVVDEHVTEARQDATERAAEATDINTLINLLAWVDSRIEAEVTHRPDVNVHKRVLSDTWGQVREHLLARKKEAETPVERIAVIQAEARVALPAGASADWTPEEEEALAAVPQTPCTGNEPRCKWVNNANGAPGSRCTVCGDSIPF